LAEAVSRTGARRARGVRLQPDQRAAGIGGVASDVRRRSRGRTDVNRHPADALRRRDADHPETMIAPVLMYNFAHVQRTREAARDRSRSCQSARGDPEIQAFITDTMRRAQK